MKDRGGPIPEEEQRSNSHYQVEGKHVPFNKAATLRLGLRTPALLQLTGERPICTVSRRSLSWLSCPSQFDSVMLFKGELRVKPDSEPQSARK